MLQGEQSFPEKIHQVIVSNIKSNEITQESLKSQYLRNSISTSVKDYAY